MRAIDGLLKIVVNQDAAELRLAPRRPPRLVHDGQERALTMPATSPELLRSLLGDLLSPHQAVLDAGGTASFPYRSESGVDFDVVVQHQPTTDGPELDVRFTRHVAGRGGHADPAPEAPGEPDLPPGLGSVLAQAVALGASDVHLTQGRPPIARVDGALRPLPGVEPPDVAALLRDRAQLERVRAGRSVDLGLDVAGAGRLRVNVYAPGDGLAAAFGCSRARRRRSPRSTCPR